MAPKRGITYSGTPFTRQLAAWMALAGLDDVALGCKVGVSKVTVGRWRSGINTPTTEKWPALARALNVTEEEIGRLLFNVELYPPDVELVARVLKKLPPRVRRVVVQELSKLIDEAESRDAEQAGSKSVNVAYVTNHANGAA